MTAPSPLEGRMVFLVGARRSGTNWLQRILGAHPDVAVVPSETHLFSHGIAPLRERFHHGALGSPKTARVYMEHDAYVRATRAFCDEVFVGLLDAIQPSARYLVERTPWHVHHLGLIGEIYPDARVVHIIRDGRDVARSLLAQRWEGTSPAEMADAAREWRDAIGDARSAALPPERYLELFYESMLADPRAGMRGLFSWLDLAASDDVIEPAVAESGASFNADATMPQVGRDKWRAGLTPEQVAAFHEVAGDTLRELGYDDGSEVDVVAAAAPRPAPRPPARARLRAAIRRPGAARSGAALDAETLVDRFDALLTAIHTVDEPALRALTTGNVAISVMSAGQQWSDRGTGGLDRFLDHLGRSKGARSRQVRGDVHPDQAGATAVLSYEARDGARCDVAVVANIAASGVSRLAWYEFPLG